MTVKELFEAEKIDLDFIDEFMVDSSPYWRSTRDFVSKNWTRDMKFLSLKQSAWLTRILDDCVERRIEGQP